LIKNEEAVKVNFCWFALYSDNRHQYL
jgi:hypothetical protein